MKRSLSGIMVILLITSMLALAFSIQPVKASGTIYIRADGSIDPPTAPISSSDNITYTFTDNIYDEIVVERDDIVVDGAGYTVQGTGSGNGISLSSRYNVTLKNVEVTNFYCGICLYSSSNNSLTGNTASSNNWGGIRLEYSSNNDVFHNNLIGNTFQAIVADIDDTNTWDNGCEGNYWSDYNGTDNDGDGIGDTPYVVDENNQDNYPLMNCYWNPADINHDLKVDIYDVVLACNAYGSTLSDPHWNPHCDITEPYGAIDIYDVVMICSSYGEEYLP